MGDINCRGCFVGGYHTETCAFYPKEKEMCKVKAAKPSEQDVKNAILEILADRKAYNTSLNYAIGYCEAGLDMIQEALRVQCLYILNNITGWRHPKAKVVRMTLKAYAGVK